MELLRRFTGEPPDLREFRQDKPTLLVSWWCAGYAITIIAFRVCGRYVRTEKTYPEDTIMLFAIIPLLIRTALAHVVLVYGTNNTKIDGLTDLEIQHRELGSQLVLATRIMYTTCLWVMKYSVSMYLRSLTESVWQRSHQTMLRYLHAFLVLTYLATVISTLAECRPFTHYWQVVPDPGAQCRQAYAQLFTMGSMNIITNIALILFPIPMILKSRLPQKTKFQTLLRLSFPLLCISLTAYQLYSVVSRHGAQQRRSLLASFDLLVSTFTSNAVVLGSLLRNRGYKKEKYKFGGYDAMRKDTKLGRERRRSRGESDEELVMGIDKELEHEGWMKPETIRMSVLPKAKAKSTRGEIRVATEWEVKVVSKRDKELPSIPRGAP